MNYFDLDHPDIRSIEFPKEWLVVGWFTPDYRQLAEKLAANLDSQHAPHHLFAVEAFGSSFHERTRRKPEIVLRAMDMYPEKALILMDVDCVVLGDLTPLTQIDSDVGIVLKARQARPPRVILSASSRVVVFRPTAGARRYGEAWLGECRSNAHLTHDDELCMLWAYLRNPLVTYSQISPEFAGREIDLPKIGEPVILHSSENTRRTFRIGLKPFLKKIEKRYFRTGRTKATLGERIG